MSEIQKARDAAKIWIVANWPALAKYAGVFVLGLFLGHRI